MAIDNKGILQQMGDMGSAEYKSRMLDDNGKAITGGEAYAILEDYPTAKNEFINTLTNKVVKTYFYSKVFTNPLSMLHRGKLAHGASIEQLFVDMAERRGFGEHFGSNATAEADLIGKQTANVHALYITRNFKYKYKVSISDVQLATAFYNEEGLSQLIAQLTSSAISRAYFDEFNDMKKVIELSAKGQMFGETPSGIPSAEVIPTGKGITKTMALKAVGTDPKDIAETIKGLSGRLAFPSTEFNMAGVNQRSEKNNLIFITTPEVNAKLDVNVLATAFNVSKAEVGVRTIEVDELPAVFNKPTEAIGTVGTGTANCVGVLLDADFLQSYDTANTTKFFENGDQLLTNMFLHKQGIQATCYFANAVALVDVLPV